MRGFSSWMLSPLSLHAVAGMAVSTIHGPQVSEVDGMLELGGGLVVGQEGVADVAVLADAAAVLRHVLVVVAAEAAGRFHVPDVARVRAPVDAHLGEAGRAEDVLQCGHGV